MHAPEHLELQRGRRLRNDAVHEAEGREGPAWHAACMRTHTDAKMIGSDHYNHEGEDLSGTPLSIAQFLDPAVSLAIDVKSNTH